MTVPVDVLSDYAALARSMGNDDSARKADEARAAVAELVAAGHRIQKTRSGADADPGSVAMMRWDEACEMFDAALAKFGSAV